MGETKYYTLMFLRQITRQNYFITAASKSFEIYANLRCLETALTNQKCIHEEIKYRLRGMLATI
jgi:hypothetical protein